MQKNTTKLPSTFKVYFWDCDFDQLSLQQYPRFIIERILNFGDDNAVRWLLQHAEPILIQRIIENSRNLTKKTRNYWHLMIK